MAECGIEVLGSQIKAPFHRSNLSRISISSRPEVRSLGVNLPKPPYAVATLSWFLGMPRGRRMTGRWKCHVRTMPINHERADRRELRSESHVSRRCGPLHAEPSHELIAVASGSNENHWSYVREGGGRLSDVELRSALPRRRVNGGRLARARNALNSSSTAASIVWRSTGSSSNMYSRAIQCALKARIAYSSQLSNPSGGGGKGGAPRIGGLAGELLGTGGCRNALMMETLPVSRDADNADDHAQNC
jgi:hypothetical protein